MVALERINRRRAGEERDTDQRSVLDADNTRTRDTHCLEVLDSEPLELRAGTLSESGVTGLLLAVLEIEDPLLDRVGDNQSVDVHLHDKMQRSVTKRLEAREM